MTYGRSNRTIGRAPARERLSDDRAALAQWAVNRGAFSHAAEVGSSAIEAMQQLFRTQLGRRDKEVWLREAKGDWCPGGL